MPIIVGDHTYEVQKVGEGDKMRIRRLLGADLVKDAEYYGTCVIASSVKEIDGLRLMSPTKPEDFERLVDKLGDALPEIAKEVLRLSGADLTEAERLVDAKN